MIDENKIAYFAETDYRNKKQKFGIKAKDRNKHVYIIGKTGMGKSTLLENLAIQDIQNGEGIAFIDPHGKSADLLLDHVPASRINDVLYFAPFDMSHPVSFNIMEDVGYDKRHFVVSGLLSAFKKIWVDAWSARMEYILSNTLLALLEYPGSTLLGVNRMYSDKAFRRKVVENITDPIVKSFWTEEFATYTDRYTQEATPAIQNKVGQFTSNPLIRNIIGQPHSSFDLRQMIDSKKIIIVNLSKGRIGEINANLLGSMFITKLYIAAMSRADVSDDALRYLPNFYLYVDEFQSFANESFADILSEARKYKLSLTIAHQYIEQMSDEVRAAVFGNVGTMVAFRVGAYDAEILEKEFAPHFTQEDLVNLGFAQVYLRLMIDGVGSQPFSARTISPIRSHDGSRKDEVVEASRRSYARYREVVERDILDWHGKGNSEKEPDANKDIHAVPKEPSPRNDFQRKRKDKKNERNGREENSTHPEHNKHIRPISLSALKDKHQPSQEHRGELRKALAEAMRGQENPVADEKKEINDSPAVKEIVTETPVLQKNLSVIDKKPVTKEIAHNETITEIPEDELRKMLEVERGS